MGLNDIEKRIAPSEYAKDDLAVQTERVDDISLTKAEAKSFTREQEKGLVRKLDIWYVHHASNIVAT